LLTWFLLLSLLIFFTASAPTETYPLSLHDALPIFLFASNNQTPPRVSSSVQGFSPGDLSVRFFSWQELVALATSTYIAPSALMANGCIGWSPPSGKPETMVSAGPLGTMAPAGSR